MTAEQDHHSAPKRTGGPVVETVEIYDTNRRLIGRETRMVCWNGDDAGHHCDLDDGHDGGHHDDCCEHGEVTWGA